MSSKKSLHVSYKITTLRISRYIWCLDVLFDFDFDSDFDDRFRHLIHVPKINFNCKRKIQIEYINIDI